MAIRYHCRHCETEVGRLPFGSAGEVQALHRLADGEADDFITEGEDGEVTVRCICEHCQESLGQFPDYYALQKWLQ